MEGQTQYLSRSQFAAQQGWSASYVTKLGQQGRLVLGEDPKLIDVPATLVKLRDTRDPAKQSVRERHAAARAEKHVGAQTKPGATTGDEPPAHDADPKYWDNKTRREGALAELAELELAKKRGDLVERQRVEAAAFAAGRALRDAVLGLPTQLAPEFASMTDAFQIELKLRNALRQVFADAAKMTADDMDRALEQSH